jgi:predicted ATPase/DNA-binding CsgD family transcriptional regulator
MTFATALIQGNLPAEPNSFIGRERDLADLTVLLGEVRALTLCGPGGIGKSRLALRLAREVSHQNASPLGIEEAWMVELADWQGQTAQRVAATLGVREEAGTPAQETLVEALQSRRLVLLLDTCENQIDACATLVQALLARCPYLRVIATSREPLRVRGESVWRVPPLGLPPADASPTDLATSEAIRLFAARAAAARPGFTLNDVNAAPVASLCRALDGIPLAIELAAARVRALSVEQIASRLSDRFQLLDSGDRTAPPRQRTLRGTVDWSYELLSADEQTLLRRLAVFAGWNLDMAEQVCSDERIPADDVLGLLISLIDKSLVVLDREVAGDARYRLLDTIREYALARLAESAEEPGLRRRHRDCVLEIAENSAARVFRRGEPPWPVRRDMFHRFLAERDNFRAALATSLDRGDTAEGLRLCTALRALWLPIGDSSEGIRWLDAFFARTALAGEARVAPEVLGRAANVRAELAFEQQDYQAALLHAQRGLELSRSCGDEFAVPQAIRVLSQVALRSGNYDEALVLAEESSAAAAASGNDWEAGIVLDARAAIEFRQGKLKAAQRSYEAALSLLSDNLQWGVAHVQYGMGILARERGDHEAAFRHFEEAMPIFLDLDSRPEIARCLAGLGRVALAQGDLRLARTRLTESLQLSRAVGQRIAISRGLDAFATLSSAEHEPERALRLAGAALALRESIGHAHGGGSRLETLLEPVRSRLGDGGAAALLAEGRAMTPDEAVGFAVQPSGASTAQTHAAQTHTSQTHTSQLRPDQAHDPGQPPAGTPAPSPSPLTPREREIAILIARGLSNRGIADELVISPATAARHVANILTKLGFTSRAQVAAWAVHRGKNSPG